MKQTNGIQISKSNKRRVTATCSVHKTTARVVNHSSIEATNCSKERGSKLFKSGTFNINAGVLPSYYLITCILATNSKVTHNIDFSLYRDSREYQSCQYLPIWQFLRFVDFDFRFTRKMTFWVYTIKVLNGHCLMLCVAGLLTKKFLNLIQAVPDGTLDLNKTADILEVIFW